MSGAREARRATSAHAVPKWHFGCAGLFSALFATSLTHPIDVVKIHLQIQRNSSWTTFKAAQSIYTLSGLKGFYRGWAPNFIGNASAWGSYFFLYAIVKDKWKTQRNVQRLAFYDHLICASATGAVVSTLTNPIWVLKTRMVLYKEEQKKVQRNLVSSKNARKASSSVDYSTLSNAVKTIWKGEGFRGFFTGFVPGLIGISHGAVQFMVYENLKSRRNKFLKRRAMQTRSRKSIENNNNMNNNNNSINNIKNTINNTNSINENNNKASAFDFLVIGAFSKMIATLATYPYQVMRTRLQEAPSPVGAALEAKAGFAQGRTLRSAHKTPAAARQTLVGLMRDTLQREGLRGFYRGCGAAVLRVTPHAALVFTGYEVILKFLNKSQ